MKTLVFRCWNLYYIAGVVCSARTISFETLNGAQFSLLTHLTIYPITFYTLSLTQHQYQSKLNPFIHAAVWSDRAWLRPFPLFVMSAGVFTRNKLKSPFVYQRANTCKNDFYDLN